MSAPRYSTRSNPIPRVSCPISAPWSIGGSRRRPSQGSKSQQRDVEIVVAACFAIEEEIERPASADPPWPLEGGQEPSKFTGMKRLPSPEERIVTSFADRG